MLKLLAALPSERQGDERWVRQRVLLDWERWPEGAADSVADGTAGSAAGSAADGVQADELPATHLHILQQAVWHDQRVRIRYRREASFYHRQFSRLVEPYGLAAKAGVWHVVCAADARVRVFAVNELLSVEPTGKAFVRPADFDLEEFWRQWRRQRRAEQGRFRVQVRVSPAMAAELPLHLGEVVRPQLAAAPGGATPGDEWLTIQLHFNSFEEARTKLLGLGAGVEVETPAALRLSVLDYAQQVVQLYSRR
jgi:predicted DNA-binding transcriptional regulator YafY